MTTSDEINREIAKNIEALALATKFRAEFEKGEAEFADWYSRLKDKRPDVIQTSQEYGRKKNVEAQKIATLTERNKVLNEQLPNVLKEEQKARENKAERDLIETKAKAKAEEEQSKAKGEAQKKLAEKGLTPESILAEQKAKAKAESDLAKAKADLEKQKADNEMALKMAKENVPKGMNPILKISLIALGVAGVMIGGFLLVKKK
jgi:uncharacterized membrane protein YqiK